MPNALYYKFWATGVRIRDAAKQIGISGPIEPLLAYIGPRLVRPPNVETKITLPSGDCIWVPPNFPSYMNYVLNMYERALVHLLPSLVKREMTVLDVGANVGLHTVAMSRLVGPGGRVFAFEADPLVFKYLQRNLAMNECSNVLPLNLAVTDRSTRVQFVPDSHERGFVIAPDRGGSRLEIDSVSLDDYFRSRGWPKADFVKLDIEGSEFDALAGMVELSERNSGLVLVMEYNAEAIRRAGHTKADLSAKLSELGFRHGLVIERRLEPLKNGLSMPQDSALLNLVLSKGPTRV